MDINVDGVQGWICDVGKFMDLAPINEGQAEDEWAHQNAGDDVSGDVGQMKDFHEASGEKPHENQARYIERNRKEIDRHSGSERTFVVLQRSGEHAPSQLFEIIGLHPNHCLEPF